MIPQNASAMLHDDEGKFIAGWVSSEVCGKCRQQLVYYYELYDSCFCAACNEWVESAVSGGEGTLPIRPLPNERK